MATGQAAYDLSAEVVTGAFVFWARVAQPDDKKVRSLARPRAEQG